MNTEEFEKKLAKIKNLPPTIRIKKIKELEEERKTSIEKESKTVIDDSIKEIENEQQEELDKLEAAIKESEDQYTKEHENQPIPNLESISSDYGVANSYLAGQKDKSMSELYNRLQNLGGQVESGYETLETATDIYNQIMDYAAKESTEPMNSMEAKDIKTGARKLMEQIGLYFAKDINYDP